MQLLDGHRRPCAPAPLRGPLSPPHRLDGHPLAKRVLATYATHRAKGPAPLAKKKGGLATYGQKGPALRCLPPPHRLTGGLPTDLRGRPSPYPTFPTSPNSPPDFPQLPQLPPTGIKVLGVK